MRVPEHVPNHVVILGLGPSLGSYIEIAKRMGDRYAFADEVWGINAVGAVVQCDRVFHMDDVAVQEIRARKRPKSNIARMLDWLRREDMVPVYTSVVRDGYPSLIPYPIDAVVRSCGWAYFNSTAAYAVALAVHLGVKKISLFGCDFTYPNAHDAEKGRACVEFHLGMAAAKGIEIGIPGSTSLLDSISPMGDRVYGYDAFDVSVIHDDADPDGRLAFTPKDLPTADEIEARYDHSAHPNPLVSGQTK